MRINQLLSPKPQSEAEKHGEKSNIRIIGLVNVIMRICATEKIIRFVFRRRMLHAPSITMGSMISRSRCRSRLWCGFCHGFCRKRLQLHKKRWRSERAEENRELKIFHQLRARSSQGNPPFGRCKVSSSNVLQRNATPMRPRVEKLKEHPATQRARRHRGILAFD